MPTPILDALKQYNNEDYVRFHMPGHKGKGQDLSMGWDLTEVLYLDDIHKPDGIIKEAEDLAAKAYKAWHTFFITCGSTMGIHAMLNAVDGKVIMGRDAHKAAINAIYLYNIDAVFTKCYNTFVTTDEYITAINENLDAKYLYITYPNYYGDCVDIEKIAKAAKEADISLLIDQAHGAHFDFSNDLPVSGGDVGACMWVQSAHKTLPALTPGALLHSNANAYERLEQSLWQLHTTSPSYLILASIDYARDYMEKNSDIIKTWIDTCKKEKDKLKTVIRVMDTKDITRFTIDANSIGLSGFALAKELLKDKIVVEMSDFRYVVCITSPVDIKSIATLYNSIKNINHGDYKLSMPNYKMEPWEKIDIKNMKKYKIQLGCSVGEIIATPTGAYPPGIANVLPGEVITKEIVDFFENVISCGGSVFGMDAENQLTIVR